MTFGGECVKINVTDLISKGFPVYPACGSIFRVLICLSILVVSVQYEDENRTHARGSGGMRFLTGGALLALTCFVAGLT